MWGGGLQKMDNIEMILQILNSEIEKPFDCILAYQNGVSPQKPYATLYELEPILDDVYRGTYAEEKTSSKYYGEYPVQFDIFSKDIKASRENSKDYWEYIMFKLRDILGTYGIGVTAHTGPNPNYEFIQGQYEYRRTFRVTFEFNSDVDRITELAERIELTANKRKVNIEIKGE